MILGGPADMCVGGVNGYKKWYEKNGGSTNEGFTEVYGQRCCFSDHSGGGADHCGYADHALVMTVTLFGVRNAAAAIFYGIFGVIGLMKVRKPGALFMLTTIIIVTHDYRCAGVLTDRVMWIKDETLYKLGGRDLIEEYFCVSSEACI